MTSVVVVPLAVGVVEVHRVTVRQAVLLEEVLEGSHEQTELHVALVHESIGKRETCRRFREVSIAVESENERQRKAELAPARRSRVVSGR